MSLSLLLAASMSLKDGSPTTIQAVNEVFGKSALISVMKSSSSTEHSARHVALLVMRLDSLDCNGQNGRARRLSRTQWGKLRAEFENT
jgi:hypothetical protein